MGAPDGCPWPGPGAAPPDSLPDFPMRRPGPFALPAAYGEIREDAAVRRARLTDGTTVWLISRYDDIRGLMGDARLSADRTRAGFPFLDEETAQLKSVPVFLGMDAPEHLTYRRMFLPEFLPRQVDALEPFVQRCVDEHLDRMLDHGAPADLVSYLAMPIPALTVGRIIGVPHADLPRLEELCVAALRDREPAAFQALFDFVREVTEAKGASASSPVTGMIGRMLRDHVARGDIDQWALLASVFVILMAGYETTAHMISLGTLLLLQHPEQLERLRHNPERTPAAVEEMLRYLSVGELAAVRIATEDITLHGATIRAGEGVILLGAAGNRDPRAFDTPEQFDIDRALPIRHLSFGHGPHACIGARVARLELRIVFTTLLKRLPHLRLAHDITDDAVDYEAVLFGLKRLEIMW